MLAMLVLIFFIRKSLGKIYLFYTIIFLVQKKHLYTIGTRILF